MLGVGKPRPIAFANGGCKSEGNSGPATTATGFRLQWLALAGFAQDDLEITFHSNLLSVSGKKQETSAEGYLHRGNAGPSVRTSVRACRSCPGERSGSEQRSPVDRSRSRDPRGREVAKNYHRKRPGFDVCCSGADRSAEGGLIYIVRSHGRSRDGAHQHSELERRER